MKGGIRLNKYIVFYVVGYLCLAAAAVCLLFFWETPTGMALLFALAGIGAFSVDIGSCMKKDGRLKRRHIFTGLGSLCLLAGSACKQLIANTNTGTVICLIFIAAAVLSFGFGGYLYFKE